MSVSLRAGLVYFLLVFAAGFVFGALRVTFVAPALGPFLAVLLELPLMLALSWFVCRAVIRRCAVPRDVSARALMGAVAFALLIAAELALAVFGFGATLSNALAAWRTPAGALGLAGQAVFAAFPLLVRR